MTAQGFTLFDTVIGRCGLAWGERGLIGVQLPESSPGAAWARLRKRFPEAVEAEPPPEIESIVDRIRAEGPLRSVDLEGKSGAGWWNLKLTKRLANALWSSGELAIRERRSFQRSYDLPERVIPAGLLGREVPRGEAFEILLLRALEGFGWATTSTLAQTWRLRKAKADIDGALRRLVDRGAIVHAAIIDDAMLTVRHDDETNLPVFQPAATDGLSVQGKGVAHGPG